MFLLLVKLLANTTPDLIEAASNTEDEPEIEAPAVYTPLPTIDAVLISVQVTPRRAQIQVDGKLAESNPIQIERGKEPVELLVWDEGYIPRRVRVVPSENREITLRLRKDTTAGARDQK